MGFFRKNRPTKRVVVAGCRHYTNYEEAKAFIDRCIKNLRKENTIVIVSGAARGADTLGERYAKENGLEIERHPADWNRYGKSAGIRRNRKMAEVSDYVICFWDGQSRGTKSMIDYAVACGKPIKIKRI